MKLFDERDRGAPPLPPPVRVNGVEVPRLAIIREMQNHPAASPKAAREAATAALVVRELLLQEARRFGLEATPATDADGRRETEEEALIRQLIEREVALPQVEAAACRRFYDANLHRFRSPDVCEAFHILFAARREDERAYAEARRYAETAIAELIREPGRFEELARTLSACPSAANGGSLGQITSGQTVPEFEAALAGMAPNTLCPAPVETRYGVHVVRIGRKLQGRTLPFEAVKERIADYLADLVFRRAVRQYIAILAGRAAIEGASLAGAGSMLVQ
jgi:peptidyl-prolyl cis-trans isomerase C